MAHDFEVDMASGTSEDAPSTRGIVPPPSGKAAYAHPLLAAIDERDARIKELYVALNERNERIKELETDLVSEVQERAKLVDACDRREARITELEAKRDAWEETARQNQRNTDYYRGLVVVVGRMFGTAAYTQDDGGIVNEVLCAKVPELVAAMQASLLAESERAEMLASELDRVLYLHAAREALGKEER